MSHSANFRATFVGADDEVRSRLADTRSYRLMSEPIPLRGAHLQAMPRPRRSRSLHFAPHKKLRAFTPIPVTLAATRPQIIHETFTNIRMFRQRAESPTHRRPITIYAVVRIVGRSRRRGFQFRRNPSNPVCPSAEIPRQQRPLSSHERLKVSASDEENNTSLFLFSSARRLLGVLISSSRDE